MLHEPVDEGVVAGNAALQPVLKVQFERAGHPLHGLDRTLSQAVRSFVVRRRVLLLHHLLGIRVGVVHSHAEVYQAFLEERQDGRFVVALQADVTVPQPFQVVDETVSSVPALADSFVAHCMREDGLAVAVLGHDNFQQYGVCLLHLVSCEEPAISRNKQVVEAKDWDAPLVWTRSVLQTT